MPNTLTPHYIQYRNTAELVLAFNRLSVNSSEKADLKSVAMRVIEEFSNQNIKTAERIQELLPLAACNDDDVRKKVYLAMIQPIHDEVLLDPNMIHGLAKMIEIAQADHVDKNKQDLLRMFEVIVDKIPKSPQSFEEGSELESILSAAAALLDAMLDKGVGPVSKEGERDPQHQKLSELKKETGTFRLEYLTSYVLQGLLRIPDDETKQRALMRRGLLLFQAFMGMANVVSSFSLTFSDAKEIVSSLIQAFKTKGRKKEWFEFTRATADVIENIDENETALSEFIAEIEKETDQLKKWFFVYKFIDVLREKAQKTKNTALQQKILGKIRDIYFDEKWSSDKRVFTHVLSTLIELMKKDEPLVSALAEKMLVQIKGKLRELTEDKKSTRHQAFRDALMREGVENISAIKRKETISVIETHAELSLLESARRAILPLDYRVERIISNASLLRSSGSELSEELDRYVPLRSRLSEYGKESLDALEEIKKVLSASTDGKILLIQGEAGGGKSLFLRQIETEVWNNFDGSKPIPLFISLPSLEDPAHKAIEQYLKSYGCTDDEIARFQSEREFIFLLDGFDEIKTNKNLYETNQLHKWRAKTIITCRREYLTGQNYQGFFRSNSQQSLFEMYINPFEQAQIDHYLENIAQASKGEWNDPKKYHEVLNSVPGLNDMVQTPFILNIISQILPKLDEARKQNPALMCRTIRRADVYEIFAEHWFEKEEIKLLRSAVDILEGYDLKKSFLEFSKDLALRMFWAAKTSVPMQGNSYSIQKLTQDPWRRFFKTKEEDLKVWLARQGAIIKKAGNQIGFIHKSILEYFVARALFSEIDGDRTQLLSEKSFLNKKSLEKEPSILLFLADMVANYEEAKEKLFSLVHASAKKENLSTGASSALSILNAAGASFATMNLSGIHTPHAYLRNANLSGTRFENADLSSSDLTGAFLENANFQGANLENISLGQRPYLNVFSKIHGMAISPDQTKIASATRNGLVSLWDVHTLKPVNDLHSLYNLGKEIIFDMSFSPDRKWIALACGDDLIRIIDAATLSLSGTPLKGHTDVVRSVCFSPDGKTLASGSWDKTVRLWDFNTRQALGEPLVEHKEGVICVVFSPNGKYIASGGRDKIFYAHETETRKLVFAKEKHSNTIMSIAFSKDGEKVVTGSWDKTACLWGFNTRNCEKVFNFDGLVSAIAFSPDEKNLAVSIAIESEKKYSIVLKEIVSPDKKEKYFEGHSASIYSLSFSKDGNKLISSSFDKSACLWDLKTSTTKMKLEHYSALFSAKLSADEKKVICVGYDGLLAFWDAETGLRCDEHLPKHTGPAFSVVYSPNGKRIISGGFGGSLRFWDGKTGKPCEPKALERKAHEGDIDALAYSFSGKFFASGGGDKKIKLWDAENLTMLFELPIYSDEIYSLVFCKDDKNIISGHKDNHIYISPLNNEQPPVLLGDHNKSVCRLSLSSDGETLASAGADNKIYVWNLANRQLEKGPFSSQYTPLALSFSKNAKKINVGYGDGMICMLDAQSGSLQGEPLTGHTETVSAVSILSASDLLLSASFDGMIRFWQMTGNHFIGNSLPEGHVANVTSLQFWPNNPEMIVSTGVDKTLRFWNADSGELADKTWGGFTDPIYAISCSFDGKNIAIASAKTIQIASYPSRDLVQSPTQIHDDKYFSRLCFSPNEPLLAFSDGKTYNEVYLWDLTQSLLKNDKPIHSHQKQVNEICFSPDGTLLATASLDNTIRLSFVHDVEKTPYSKPLRGHVNGGVYSVCFAVDSMTLISGGWDKTVRVWDLSASDYDAPTKTLYGHEELITRVRVSSEGVIASASNDKSICLWDLKTGHLLHRGFWHASSVNTLSFSEDGMQLVSGSQDKTVRAWKIPKYSKKNKSNLTPFLMWQKGPHYLTLNNADVSKAKMSMGTATLFSQMGAKKIEKSETLEKQTVKPEKSADVKPLSRELVPAKKGEAPSTPEKAKEKITAIPALISSAKSMRQNPSSPSKISKTSAPSSSGTPRVTNRAAKIEESTSSQKKTRS